MARIAILTILLLATGVMTGSAVTQDSGLFTNCAPMALAVSDLAPEEMQVSGLTTQAITNAAEARLRSARLLVPIKKQIDNQEIRDLAQFLDVIIHIVGPSVSVRIQLSRYMKDLGYGVPGLPVVWETGFIGTHGDDGNYILGGVSQLLDQFLATYLRVNEGHCSR